MHRWCSWPPVSAVRCMYMLQQLTHMCLFACEHTILGCVYLLLYRLEDMLLYSCFPCVHVWKYIPVCVSRHVIIVWIIQWRMKRTCSFATPPSWIDLVNKPSCWQHCDISTACSECITHMNLWLYACVSSLLLYNTHWTGQTVQWHK